MLREMPLPPFFPSSLPLPFSLSLSFVPSFPLSLSLSLSFPFLLSSLPPFLPFFPPFLPFFILFTSHKSKIICKTARVAFFLIKLQVTISISSNTPLPLLLPLYFSWGEGKKHLLGCAAGVGMWCRWGYYRRTAALWPSFQQRQNPCSDGP